MKPVLEIERLLKQYPGLRPLRLDRLRVGRDDRVSILGLDAGAAEAFVNVVTGAALPDEGTVRVQGRETSAIGGSDEWLQALEAFGLVSRRAVLLDDLSVAQNMAMAFTLSIDPVPDAVLADVRRLSVEAGVPLTDLDRRLGDVRAETVARCHLARALAADPVLLLLEHANALTEAADAPAFGRDIARVAAGRHLAVLAMTADESFAHAVATTVYRIEPASGHLASVSGWRRWLR